MMLTIFNQRLLISGSSIYNSTTREVDLKLPRHLTYYPPNDYVIHIAPFDFSLVTALCMECLPCRATYQQLLWSLLIGQKPKHVSSESKTWKMHVLMFFTMFPLYRKANKEVYM